MSWRLLWRFLPNMWSSLNVFSQFSTIWLIPPCTVQEMNIRVNQLGICFISFHIQRKSFKNYKTILNYFLTLWFLLAIFCASNPCQFDGPCNKESSTCICNDEYTGNICQTCECFSSFNLLIGYLSILRL